MDQITDAMGMIEHLNTPAFCVRQGIITNVNEAAKGRTIEPETPITDYLKTGMDEYRDFAGGCLYLTLEICGQNLGFSVVRKQNFDLFQLEQVVADFQGLGIGMTLIAWLLGNIALIMLDVVLGRAVGLKRVAK